MKRLRWLLLLSMMPMSLMAWERSMLHLTVPTNLDKFQLQFTVNHRFRGPIDQQPLDTFFGIKSGANVGTGFRFAILQGLEVKAHIFYSRNEYAFGGAYGMDFKPLRLKARSLYLVVLMPDADDAGWGMVTSASERNLSSHCRLKVCRLPKGDPADYSGNELKKFLGQAALVRRVF